ncbi:MAG: DUF692 domain-containing protein [Pyrinomonadaceae bacterium]
MFAELPKLGAGLGFRAPLRSGIFLNRSNIDLLEITADHYIDAGPRKMEELDLLSEHFPLVPHSLDLSLGSAEGIDDAYLDKLAEVIERVRPPWFSDHICFTRSGGVSIGHLAPLPFTREALDVLNQNIEKVKKCIPKPLILENITYNVRFPSSEMTEGEFISTLLGETGCGMLLDVTNLYINSVNLGYDWRDYLDSIPLEQVVQVHFVGSHRHNGRLIDAHADRTETEIWRVFREVCQRSDIKGAILERDENIPDIADLLDEVRTARAIMTDPSESRRSDRRLAENFGVAGIGTN